MSSAARNVLIVLALAAAVFAIPGGGDAASVVGGVLSTLVTVAFVAFGWRFYQERRMDIHSLGDPYRGAFYGALAGIVFALAGVGQLMESGAGTLAWFIIVGLSVYALFRVFWQWRDLNAY